MVLGGFSIDLFGSFTLRMLIPTDFIKGAETTTELEKKKPAKPGVGSTIGKPCNVHNLLAIEMAIVHAQFLFSNSYR